MAIIKKSKLREMSDAELQTKLFDFQKELNSERGLLAAGGRASNTGKVSELRKSVARILTILHERKLGIVRKVKAFAGKKEEPAKKAEAKK
ncbi:MAG: 50S ribosomal protein L29 [Candidatus Micrarchaeia archaeon]